MRRNLAILICSALVSLPSLDLLAGSASGRPNLAPVAMEARCPLADGTWDLDGALAQLTAAPPAVADSPDAADPPDARPEAEPAAACVADACVADDSGDEACREALAADASEADAADDSGTAADASGAAGDEQLAVAEDVGEAIADDAPAAGEEAPAAAEEALTPSSIVVRRLAWAEEYLPYDLGASDRLRLQLFPLKLPRFSYLPLGPVDERKTEVDAPAADRASAAGSEEEAGAGSTDAIALTPAANSVDSESEPSVDGASSLLASADCLLDDLFWHATRLVEETQVSWQDAVRRGGGRLAGPSASVAAQLAAMLPSPPAEIPGEGAVAETLEAIAASSPTEPSREGDACAAEPCEMAGPDAAGEEEGAAVVLVGPPAPNQKLNEPLASDETVADWIAAAEADSHGPAEASLAETPEPRGAEAEPRDATSSLFATAEGLKAAGSVLRHLGEQLEQMATRQARAQGEAKQF